MSNPTPRDEQGWEQLIKQVKQVRQDLIDKLLERELGEEVSFSEADLVYLRQEGIVNNEGQLVRGARNAIAGSELGWLTQLGRGGFATWTPEQRAAYRRSVSGS